MSQIKNNVTTTHSRSHFTLIYVIKGEGKILQLSFHADFKYPQSLNMCDCVNKQNQTKL